MTDAFSGVLSSLTSSLLSDTHNRYQLTLAHLTSALSIFSVNIDEQLNQPWRYDITVTSSDFSLTAQDVLNQAASFTFLAPSALSQITQISSLDKPATNRTVYGVITEFSQLSVSHDEARYRLMLQPRLALLAYSHGSEIYQNQNVVAVVESVLRRHGFTGVDYRLALSSQYPTREFITQWQESDLAFIQRLLADVGIHFRFESHSQHQCDVVVLSDDVQQFTDAGSIVYNPPSGMADRGRDSVWDVQLTGQIVSNNVVVQDYNYREASGDLQAEVNSQPTDETTQGSDYRYGEHYLATGDSDTVESGHWYALIRHQQYISQQVIIQGQCNDYQLVPGQRILLSGSPLTGIDDGVIIVATSGYGDRSESYQLSFTAIPYNALKPYRPKLKAWPQISGTLPARITSPDNDTYGYLDTQGRYRVKFNFDLKSWASGEESLWLRLARPYAGSTYGFHFPLIDGTEVAIAFTEGNPDRPYIAYALHDSNHPDHVTTTNKQRNVIRTPANNKLRMDDQRGQEHIKLATEYGKTQLNLGHLVDQSKTARGEGFELRTDEWGAIAANKGLYLTAATEPQAKGQQLDMQGAITQLENALSIAKALQNAANTAQAHPADTDSQTELQTALKPLTQAGIIAYAPEGIGLVSDSNIQLTSANSLTLTSENQTDISSLKNLTLASGEAVSLFAHKSGMKLFANQGKVEVQAQNDAMDIAAKQNIKVDSVDGNITITASKEITLVGDGSYIKITPGGIELGSSGNVSVKAAALQKMGAATMNFSPIDVPDTFTEEDMQEGITLYLETDDGYPIPTTKYIVRFENGLLRQGRLDKEGKAVLKHVPIDMNYAYAYPDVDDILAKANAQRLYHAIQVGNSDNIINYLSTSKEIVVKIQQVYKEMYQQDLIQTLKQAIGPYNNKKKVIDYLLAKANLIK